MIEYRTYTGTAGEIARFLQVVWLPAFRDKATIPVWDESFLEWQLLGSDFKDHLVAAYDGRELVGCLLAQPFRFRCRGAEIDAAMSSWLTVHPSQRGRGIGRGLAEEQRRRLLARGAKFLLGFGIPDNGDLGRRFWSAVPGGVVSGRVHWWTHVLDPAAVMRAEARLERRLGARLIGLLGGMRGPGATVSRDYEANDVNACLELLTVATADADLTYVWTRERLSRQLQYRGVPRTRVLEKNGRVAAFVNYHHVDLQSRSFLRAAIIDHFVAPGISRSERCLLLREAVVAIRDEGAALVLTSRAAGASPSVLAAGRFAPVWPGFHVIFFCADDSIDCRRVSSLRVHLR